MEISITNSGQQVVLAAPFNPDLPSAARRIGGKFDGASKTWTFDARDKDRVRELARDIYGTDGTPTRTVTVRWTLGWDDRNERELWLAGRPIAARIARDSAARLGEGVIIIAGGFPSSGGSVKNPRLQAREDTVLEIRDLPAEHADLDDERITIVEDCGVQAADADALLAEREQLLARIAEIDALLSAPDGAEATAEQAAVALPS